VLAQFRDIPIATFNEAPGSSILEICFTSFPALKTGTTQILLENIRCTIWTYTDFLLIRRKQCPMSTVDTNSLTTDIAQIHAIKIRIVSLKYVPVNSN